MVARQSKTFKHMAESVSRREFIKTTATGMAGVAAAAPNLIDVRELGAVGDGKADDTPAIRKALEKAAKTRGSVYFPEGVFACANLKVPPFVGLCGNPTWSYGEY